MMMTNYAQTNDNPPSFSNSYQMPEYDPIPSPANVCIQIDTISFSGQSNLLATSEIIPDPSNIVLCVSFYIYN